ncbi:MAG: hypothetical protein ACYC2H_11490 [Thermoplasmatota archaeon]
MAAIAPANLAAITMAIFGVGLIAAAFLGAGVDALRLFFGIVFVVAALITAGLNLLMRHGASTSVGEEA